MPFRNKPPDVRAAYAAIVKLARAPELYRAGGVPDSFDGRFDMMAVHVHLVLRRLRRAGAEHEEASQELFDLFFRDMDQSMRGAGIGDMGIARKIRTMVEAFYGRAAAYDAALNTGKKTALCAVLARNLFPTEPAAPTGVRCAPLAAYIAELEIALSVRSPEAVLAGDLCTPDIALPRQ